MLMHETDEFLKIAQHGFRRFPPGPGKIVLARVHHDRAWLIGQAILRA
jgi:hypothetical protein